MTVRVEVLDEPLGASIAEQIDRLLSSARTPDVLGYHARAYQNAMTRILDDRVRHLLATDGSGTVVGYLPFRERSTELGRVLCALPFFGPNGLVHVGDGAPPETLELLLRAYRSAASGALAVALYTPFLAPVEAIARAFDPADRVEKFMQYLDLQTIDQWPPKRRADIKRALAAGLTVRPAVRGDLERIIRLHRTSAALVGAPIKPATYLEATLDLSLRRPGEARWTVAERAGSSGAPVACLLTVQGPLTVSYVLPATMPEERPNQAVPLLIDESVSHARRSGARYWNMESSVRWDDSVFKFKERWGARTGTYAILIAYPSGKATAEAISEADLKTRYPHYFVRPFSTVSGTTASLTAP